MKALMSEPEGTLISADRGKKTTEYPINTISNVPSTKKGYCPYPKSRLLIRRHISSKHQHRKIELSKMLIIHLVLTNGKKQKKKCLRPSNKSQKKQTQHERNRGLLCSICEGALQMKFGQHEPHLTDPPKADTYYLPSRLLRTTFVMAEHLQSENTGG